METESLPDFSAFAVRQADPRFRSPGIVRKHLGKEAVTAYSVRKSRRAKSTEPNPLDPKDLPDDQDNKEVAYSLEPSEVGSQPWSMNAKTQENMSKSELVNSYRLLMNEKLRLERFLSIMSKNHEMARNRLESDLLDAMMCIEDLKQALELRMARRRKIDPREAEERRYLIRQNKKLLNQLYESAKKIERLELTKVEMKEQLELLDFQILEVENQKAMMEEELRKLPSCNNMETQTEEPSDSMPQMLHQLHNQLVELKSELSNQKAQTAAALAKHHHLDNLVRELRRDNVELRDQLAKLDDAENSLAESDKPLASGTRNLQSLLDTQLERVRDLETKLKASRDYSDELEERLKQMDLFKTSPTTPVGSPDSDKPDAQATMHRVMDETGHGMALRVPRVDDLLLQETIRTFHTLLAERDHELVQLRRQIRANVDNDNTTSLVLPELCESVIQTDIHMEQAEKLSQLAKTVADGGLLLTMEQGASLINEINRCLTILSQYDEANSAEPKLPPADGELLSFGDLIEAVNQLSQLAESVQLRVAVSGLPGQQAVTNSFMPTSIDEAENEMVPPGSYSEKNKASFPSQPKSSTGAGDGQVNSPEGTQRPSSAPAETLVQNPGDDTCPQAPRHYSTQLQALREATDVEVAKAHLSVSERRRQELERRLIELTDDLARSKAEARGAETSLSAARRTEAALRRRLLVAMDIQGSDVDAFSSRHSLGLSLNSAVDTRDNLELQAALIKSEATSASLSEAAQLDRTRLHEQSMRIGQLEAEHRALMDRLSILQANEASAQRGIVRLQALYEDMLREYSEARFQDLSWRSRDRSRSKFGNGSSNGVEKKTNGTSPHPTFTKLQRQITALEEENQTLRLAVKHAEENRGTVTTIPVGRCNAPACVEVRALLKAFQDRFADVMGQLTRTQQCLEVATTGEGLDPAIQLAPSAGLALVTSVQKCFSALQDLVDTDSATLSELELKHVRARMAECLDALARLHRWLQLYIRSTDTEIAQLRSTILEMQIAAMGNDQTLVTTYANGTDDHPFSCSISLNKKLDLDLLQQREHELQQLHGRVRDLEAAAGVTIPSYR